MTARVCCARDLGTDNLETQQWCRQPEDDQVSLAPTDIGPFWRGMGWDEPMDLDSLSNDSTNKVMDAPAASAEVKTEEPQSKASKTSDEEAKKTPHEPEVLPPTKNLGKEKDEEKMPKKNETGEAVKLCTTRLITPKGCDVPIHQKKVNIFNPSVCRELTWEETEAAESRKAKRDNEQKENPPDKVDVGSLDVKGRDWATHDELKVARRPKTQKKNAKQEEKPSASMPDQPESWGKHDILKPEVQCPPKKRGRKPKAKVADDDKEVEKETKRKRSRTGAKGGAPKKKAKNEDENEPAEPAKKKRNARKTKDDDSCEKGDKNGKKAKEVIAKKGEGEVGKPAKGKKSEAQQKAKDSKSKNADGEVAEPEDEAADSPAASSSASSRTRQHLKDAKAKRVEKEEAKKRASRKSSAYHCAYRATEGTEEQKRAAGKKASCRN